MTTERFRHLEVAIALARLRERHWCETPATDTNTEWQRLQTYLDRAVDQAMKLAGYRPIEKE